MFHIMKFNQFINESTTNEMRHRRSYRRGYGSPNGTADYYDVLPKDEMRARQLSKRKVNTRPELTDLQIAIGNARKMSKVIQDRGKLIARMEAVYNEWGAGPVLQPFIDRIVEIEPSPKYTAAWRIGLRDGAVAQDPAGYQGEDDMDAMANIMADLGMLAPTEGFQGNAAEKIIYQVAYDKAQAGIAAESLLPSGTNATL